MTHPRSPRQARAARAEHGFTLVEILVTSTLMLVVLAIVLPMVSGSLNTLTNTQVRSDATDNAQLALRQVQHDVVSSNILYSDGTLTNGEGIIHLMTFGAGGSGNPICVEYQVIYPAAGPQQATMQRRTKAPGAAAYAGVWSTVMTGIVNRTQVATAPAPSPPPVFTVAGQARSLDVNLWVKVDTRATNAAAPANYTSTFTGRAIPANSSSTSAVC
jgi:prepilin-type N-terminal cleavage/methylation domain-containing protein